MSVRELTYGEVVREALAEEMRRDPRDRHAESPSPAMPASASGRRRHGAEGLIEEPLALLGA